MAQKVNYKALSAQLDEVLAQLQDPATDIDQTIKVYARGQRLVKELEQYLKTAENSIKRLNRKAAE